MADTQENPNPWHVEKSLWSKAYAWVLWNVGAWLLNEKL